MEMTPQLPSCRSVLMVGTDLATNGGISTVVRSYVESGLFQAVDCRYLVTHREGSAFTKMKAAGSAFVQAFALMARGGAPLLHVHMSSRASFWRKSVVCMIAIVMRRPYVLHAHGSEFMKFYDDECGPRAKRAVSFIIGRAVLVLALSEQWREHLTRIAPGARVEILPNAVPLPQLAETPRTSPPVVLFLGRLGRRKGTFDLINAFAKTLEQVPDAQLVCAGDGAIAEALALAERLGIRDKVECPGWLSPAVTRERLGLATIFILPSYAEGLPMALLEAMSWALPVIATPVGGIPQAVRHGENGLLVSPGNVQEIADALIRLLTNPAERARLGGAARRTVEESFSLQAAIKQLLKIYERFGIQVRALP